MLDVVWCREIRFALSYLLAEICNEENMAKPLWRHSDVIWRRIEKYVNTFFVCLIILYTVRGVRFSKFLIGWEIQCTSRGSRKAPYLPQCATFVNQTYSSQFLWGRGICQSKFQSPKCNSLWVIKLQRALRPGRVGPGRVGPGRAGPLKMKSLPYIFRKSSLARFARSWAIRYFCRYFQTQSTL